MRCVHLRLLLTFSALPLLVGLVSGPAFAQTCVSSVATNIVAGTLTLHGSDSGLAGAVQAAAGVWGGCSSTGLPTISLGSGGSLDYTVVITPVSSGPACGVTDTNSNTIYVAGAYTYQGHQYPCDINTTLEHEIGHIFGLADSSCGSTYLMGQVPLGQTDHRSLQPAECATADQNVTTPREGHTGGTGNDPCSPQVFAQLDVANDGDNPDNALPCGSPLILDMNGDGINTTSTAQPVEFDFEGEGKPTESSWTNPSTEEAFLVLDLNGNGRVDSGRELFGTDTLLPSGETARNGFEALSVYDNPGHGGNDDGKISPQDQIWPFLALWIDRNHNGISEPRELRPLGSSGIQELDLNYVETRKLDANGNWHRFVSTYTRKCKPLKGSCRVTGALEDVFFIFAR